MQQTNGRTNGRTNTPSRDRRSVTQSVTRALDVLDLLRTADGSLSAAEIAERADLDRTVVYRLLRTLADRGMVGERSGRFALGPAVVLLGQRYLDNLPLRRIALPYMIDLQTKVLRDNPWTLALSIAIDPLSVVIERMWTAATPLGLVLDLGDLDALDRTAAGRSMLAYRGEPEIGHILGDDRHDLAPILEEVRAAGGVALVDGSTTFGLQAVACAIRGADGGASAAIGVAGVDLGDELAPDSSLATQLRHAAEAVSRMLR